MGFIALACFAVAAFLLFKIAQDMGGLSCLARFWRNASQTTKKVIVGVLILAALEVVGLTSVVIEGTRPLGPEEIAQLQATQTEKARRKAEKARHEAIGQRWLRGEHITTEECTEVYGAAMCRPIDVDAAMRAVDAGVRHNRELIEMKQADEARKYFGLK